MESTRIDGGDGNQEERICPQRIFRFRFCMGPSVFVCEYVPVKCVRIPLCVSLSVCLVAVNLFKNKIERKTFC